MRQLQSLCRRRGASDKEIQACAPEGELYYRCIQKDKYRDTHLQNEFE